MVNCRNFQLYQEHMELLDCIERPFVDNVKLRRGPRPTPQIGSLSLIGHHLIFSPQKKSTLGNAGDNSELWLLHKAVDRAIAEPLAKENPSAGGILILKCKNFLQCVFEMTNVEDCEAVARSVETLANLTDPQMDYAFFYRCPFLVLDDGWTAFDANEDFARLQMRSSDRWRLSDVNKDFAICPTYPERVIIAKGIGDDFLKISATFREGRRFPVLSYYHQPTRSCILRCGQPLVGPTNRRCKEDEAILNALLTGASKGFIVDTRSKAIATNAKGKGSGGGFETAQFYSQWKYVNTHPVPRIREVHDALARLVELCNDGDGISMDRWLSRLGAGGWLQAVADTLACAGLVAQLVHNEEGATDVPVVVHGGDGTDSTLMVTALAQLLLDSDARTIRGFEALIEREWISAGHPFSLRCAHSAYATGTVTGPQEAPIFLCFLDCVWQIYTQYPCSFEFTEEFLIFLFEHAYASEFGSFLGNSEMEKKQLKIKERTVSLWSHVNNPEILQSFVNALYEPNDGVLWPSVAAQSIQLWERLFLRWSRDWTEADLCQKTVMQWKIREKELQSKVLTMRRQVAELSHDAQPQQHAQLQ